jgi:hypothetical protein
MKKLFIIASLMVSILSFSQENKKDSNKNVDRNVTQRMDSLSKVYKVKVIGAYKITHNGVFVQGFVYEDKNGKLIQKETKRIKIN